MNLLLAVALLAAPSTPASKDTPPPFDSALVEKATGAKGQWSQAEGVFKVSLPRSDIAPQLAGVKLTPAMGLASWAAFRKMGSHYMVMGDQVLTEGQVDAVMSAALEGGLEVTALHNHFLTESPKVMFMHVGGEGELQKLAAAIGKVFAAEKQPAPASKSVDIDPAKSTLDAAKLDAALGTKGTLANGVYKATWGRTTKVAGDEMGNAMGVNTWAAFAGSNDLAVVDGDFAMLEGEVQKVLHALRSNGLSVVALHNHMLGETPRMIFLHYWGTGPAEKLAAAVKAGLAQTAAK